MSIKEDKLKYLVNWIEADGYEAPILLSGNKTDLAELMKVLAAKDDFEVLELESDKKTLAIKDLREVMKELNKTSLKNRRLVILPDVDRLSIPAGNSLLKSLEEPSKSTRYILTTQYPLRLFATILSRCTHIRLGNVGEGSIVELDPELAEISRSLSSQLIEAGPSTELRTAYTRLRDYYRIKGDKGNEKLAREVLVASLPEIVA